MAYIGSNHFYGRIIHPLPSASLEGHNNLEQNSYKRSWTRIWN